MPILIVPELPFNGAIQLSHVFFSVTIGHSVVSKTPSLSSSKSNASGIPSPSESVHNSLVLSKAYVA